MTVEVINGTKLDKTLKAESRSVEVAQMATAREFERLARPYVPWREGTLSRSTSRSHFERGEVTYDTEYACYIYYADANTHLTKDHNPNATVRWGNFVLSKYKDDLERTFKRYLSV